MAGRWEWVAGGYEANFPRGCGFTDVDAGTEFGDRALMIECKGRTSIDADLKPLPEGQRLYLQKMCTMGNHIIVLHGDARTNDPHAIELWYPGPSRRFDADRCPRFDMRTWTSIAERRQQLKLLIDKAMDVRPK